MPAGVLGPQLLHRPPPSISPTALTQTTEPATSEAAARRMLVPPCRRAYRFDLVVALQVVAAATAALGCSAFVVAASQHALTPPDGGGEWAPR